MKKSFVLFFGLLTTLAHAENTYPWLNAPKAHQLDLDSIAGTYQIDFCLGDETSADSTHEPGAEVRLDFIKTKRTTSDKKTRYEHTLTIEGALHESFSYIDQGKSHEEVKPNKVLSYLGCKLFSGLLINCEEGMKRALRSDVKSYEYKSDRESMTSETGLIQMQTTSEKTVYKNKKVVNDSKTLTQTIVVSGDALIFRRYENSKVLMACRLVK